MEWYGISIAWDLSSILVLPSAPCQCNGAIDGNKHIFKNPEEVTK